MTKPDRWQAVQALCTDDRFRAAVWKHCAFAQARRPEALNLTIHPNDQMLLHSLGHYSDVNWCLSQYFGVALQQHYAAQQILRLSFGNEVDTTRVLDFACGYGRHLRFLTLAVPPERVWASEIQHDAVEFVAREFGVHAIESASDPNAFEPDSRFDFIWVASLFSHLPALLFHAWVARLASLLTPDGVLCFSVHDERLLPAGAVMPAEGLYYVTTSEISDLDGSTYGTTFVRESFVRESVARVCGPDRPCVRLSQGLANEQDLYVVPARNDRDLNALTAFRRGTWGCVDVCRIDDTGELWLAGWAASLDDVTLEAVEVSIDGRVQRCTTGILREDVRQVTGDERLADSGFEFRTQLEGSRAALFIEVTARSGRGELGLLYSGSLARVAPTAVTDTQPMTLPQRPGVLARMKSLFR